MAGVGEYLVKATNRRGMVLFVDTDNVVKWYPEYLDKRKMMPDGYLRLLNSKYEHVRQFLIADAVTQE